VIIFISHLHLLGGSRPNIAITFGVAKLTRWSTRWQKKFESMFICFNTTHECDRQTKRRTNTTWWHKPRYV